MIEVRKRISRVTRIKRKEVVIQHTSERNKATQNRIDKKYNKGRKREMGCAERRQEEDKMT